MSVIILVARWLLEMLFLGHSLPELTVPPHAGMLDFSIFVRVLQATDTSLYLRLGLKWLFRGSQHL